VNFLKVLVELMNDGRSIGRMVGSIRKFGSTDEGDDWIRVFMDLDLGKLCMLLKVCMTFSSFS
jgi:hypothetical protein